MNKIGSEKGFGALDIILVIVALAAIGATVYFAVHNHSSAKTKTTATTTASIPPTPKAAASAKYTVAQGQAAVEQFFNKLAAAYLQTGQTPSSPGNAVPGYLTPQLAGELEHSDASAPEVDMFCGKVEPSSYTYALDSSSSTSADVKAIGKLSDGTTSTVTAAIDLNSLLITTLTCPTS